MPIYTSNAGIDAAVIAALGKFDRPIRMIVEEETDLCRKKNQFDRLIYNVMQSDKFSEAYFLENELGILSAVDEGGQGSELSSRELANKTVAHVEFKGDCLINQTLIEDSNRNEISKRVRKLVRSYWRTRDEFAQKGLINGVTRSMSFAGKTFDLTTADGLSLFNNSHGYGTGDDTQSNYYNYSTDDDIDSSMIAELMAAMAVNGRQMKSENGDPMGYTYNKIYIPGNNYALEAAVRKVIGTQYSPGNDHNDINVVHGGWQLVVLPLWNPSEDKNVFIIGSDEANENLSGSVFYDRKPFQIRKDDKFDRNDNILLHGRARMSLVHNTYKHLLMCKITGSDDESTDATELTLS